MKKICFVLIDYTVLGGVERATLTLAEALKTNYEVHLISLHYTQGSNTNHISPEIHLHVLCREPFRRVRISNKQCRGAFRRVLRQENFDAVILEGTGANFLGVLMGLGLPARFIVCDHGAIESQLDDKGTVIMRMVAARLAYRVVVLTDQSLDAYRRIFKTPARKLRRIYNWAYPEEQNREDTYDVTSRKIITAGRFVPDKHFESIVPIAKRVFARCPDWSWDVFGEGPELDRVRRAVKEAGLEERIRLMGRSSQLNDIYSQYAFYVLTSEREGLPLVLLEAKAKHLPIVSYDVSTGPREIVIDGVNGFLIPNQDQYIMAERIIALMQDDELRRSFSRHAGEGLEKFDRDSILAQWLDLTEAVTERGRQTL